MDTTVPSPFTRDETAAATRSNTPLFRRPRANASAASTSVVSVLSLLNENDFVVAIVFILRRAESLKSVGLAGAGLRCRAVAVDHPGQSPRPEAFARKGSEFGVRGRVSGCMSNKTTRILEALSSTDSGSGANAPTAGGDRLTESDRAQIEQTVKEAVSDALEAHERDAETHPDADVDETSSGRSRKQLLAGGLALVSAAYVTRRWRKSSGSTSESDSDEGYEFEPSDEAEQLQSTDAGSRSSS